MSLASLRELVAFSSAVEMKLIESGGEITAEVEKHMDMLSFVQGEALPAKVDAVQHVLIRFETLADEWKKRAQEIAAVAKGIDSARDRLKDYVKQAMLDNATDELLGGEYRFKLQKVKPRLIIRDEERIPVQYIKQVISSVIDKDMIRADLDKGNSVAGAELESSFGLRAYANKQTEKK